MRRFLAICLLSPTALTLTSLTTSAEGMTGMYGPYAMTREASGTSWQPESSPHQGLHFMGEKWMVMAHGTANGIYTDQMGPRGDDKAFSASMLMLMGQRPLGPGTFGLRGMFSLDPAMGSYGYPLLLQTGETGNGNTPLLDRQHPHDLFMEMAATYSIPAGEDGSVFAYFGYPGEPALGPPVFMHRASGMDDPEAPITHHWIDSTHVDFGVATLGYIWRELKLEGSIFTGREPNRLRWDFDPPKFDSRSVRLSYNPTADWALQASYGAITSPESLEPEVDQDRITVSAIYNKKFVGGNWQTTFAWGETRNHPGNALDAFLLESSVKFLRAHTLLGRAERVDKDELFLEPDPLAGTVATVNKISLGYIYDFPQAKHVQLGLGGIGSVHLLPANVRPAYGGGTPGSFLVFARLKLT